MNIDDILASIDAQTEEYKKQARNITNKNKSVINQQYDTANAIAEMQAREQQRLAQDQLTGLLDANAVNEAVARRNTLESLQNMGLVKSGLNETSQTAISVMRGNADASARKSVSDAVMSLSNQLAAIKAENESKRYGALAEQDIALAQEYQKADQNALKNQMTLLSDYEKQSGTAGWSSSVLTAKERQDRIKANEDWVADQNAALIKNGEDPIYDYDELGNVYRKYTDPQTGASYDVKVKSGVPGKKEDAKALISEALRYGDDTDIGGALIQAAEDMSVAEMLEALKDITGRSYTFDELEGLAADYAYAIGNLDVAVRIYNMIEDERTRIQNSLSSMYGGSTGYKNLNDVIMGRVNAAKG